MDLPGHGISAIRDHSIDSRVDHFLPSGVIWFNLMGYRSTNTGEQRILKNVQLSWCLVPGRSWQWCETWTTASVQLPYAAATSPSTQLGLKDDDNRCHGFAQRKIRTSVPQHSIHIDRHNHQIKVQWNGRDVSPKQKISEICTELWSGNRRVIYPLEDLDADGRMLLDLKQSLRVSTGIVWL